ncbi:hypothetical protein ACFOEK_09690 [Litoribrevibacter euphylliae]|uniref:Uncharacterized protein n=1 Tax=Litoribrevibacter euphylliae TaxID=1834034 RepID=A0ABV7HF61_9GAMM
MSVDDQLTYTIHFAPTQQEKLNTQLIFVMSDAFNRSIGELQKAKAIDRTELNKEYKGVGSRYYEIVTKEMESCVEQWFALIDKYNRGENLELDKIQTVI